MATTAVLHRIRTRGGTFDAVAAGPADGRKVLLLHGLTSFGGDWEPQLRALADAGCRAVAPDQRGYSREVRPPDIADYRLDHAVDDVVALADALGWQRFDLVGHDIGAAVGWVAAARHAHRIRSLTAISTPHLAVGARSLRRTVPAGAYARLVDRGALAGASNWLRANDFTGYGQRVPVPTLFVAGAADPFTMPSEVLATRRWVTGPYRLEYLAGVGHEVPAIAADLLVEHLARLRVS